MDSFGMIINGILMSITSNNKGKAPRIPLKDELDYEHASISAL